jgi:predicted metal-binding protein
MEHTTCRGVLHVLLCGVPVGLVKKGKYSGCVERVMQFGNCPGCAGKKVVRHHDDFGDLW